MEIDFEKLQPLRLATGSHRKGSGYGCAMNVVSYLNGDEVITDYPACSAVPLADAVQRLNDFLGRANGTLETSEMPEIIDADSPGGLHIQRVLSPADALTVIELGVMTIGTAVPGLTEGQMDTWARTIANDCSDPELGRRLHVHWVNIWEAHVTSKAKYPEQLALRFLDNSVPFGAAVEFVRAAILTWRKVFDLGNAPRADASSIHKTLLSVGTGNNEGMQA